MEMSQASNRIEVNDLIPTLFHHGILIFNNNEDLAWKQRIKKVHQYAFIRDEEELSIKSLQERLSVCEASSILEKSKLRSCNFDDVAEICLCYFDCVDILNALIASDELGKTVLLQYKCKVIQHWLSVIKMYQKDNLHILESCIRLVDYIEEYKRMKNALTNLRLKSNQIRCLQEDFSSTISSNSFSTASTIPFLKLQVEKCTNIIRLYEGEESRLTYQVCFCLPEKMSFLKDKLSIFLEEQLQGYSYEIFSDVF